MCVAAPPVGGHGGVLLLGYGDRSRRPGGGQRPGRHGEIHLRRRRERRVHRRIEQNVVDRQKRTRLADRLADERRFETPGDGPPHGGSQRRPGAQRPSDHLRRSLRADGDRHAGGLSRRADHPRRLDLVPGGGHGAGRGDGPPGGLPRRADARRHGSRRKSAGVRQYPGNPHRAAHPVQPRLDHHQNGPRLAHRIARNGHGIRRTGRSDAYGRAERRRGAPKAIPCWRGGHSPTKRSRRSTPAGPRAGRSSPTSPPEQPPTDSGTTSPRHPTTPPSSSSAATARDTMPSSRSGPRTTWNSSSR